MDHHCLLCQNFKRGVGGRKFENFFQGTSVHIMYLHTYKDMVIQPNPLLTIEQVLHLQVQTLKKPFFFIKSRLPHGKHFQ